VQRFRGGLVFKAHRLCVSLNYRLESNKEEEKVGVLLAEGADADEAHFGVEACRRLRRLFFRCSSQFENNYFTEICSGSEAGSYLRRIDFVYHSRLESNQEEDFGVEACRRLCRLIAFSGLGSRV